MSGKLIVLEGTDGSGKATQARMMGQRLQREGIAFREIDFPRYGNPFAEPANLYLHGRWQRAGRCECLCLLGVFRRGPLCLLQRGVGDFL